MFGVPAASVEACADCSRSFAASTAARSTGWSPTGAKPARVRTAEASAGSSSTPAVRAAQKRSAA